MTPTQLKLAALSMDLKRIALSYHGNSVHTASRFTAESMSKVKHINQTNLPTYVKKILGSLGDILNQKDKQKVAEDALMYSTILQNAALYKHE